MADTVNYAQAHSLALMQAKAAIAAALLQSGAVKISATEFITGDARKDPTFTILKTSVDKVLLAIGVTLS